MKVIRLPTVQIIGAQKAGTSAVAEWLFEEGGFGRPKLIGNEPFYYGKEVHFFDIDSRYAQGIEFYAERYLYEHREGRLDRGTLDATPDTLAWAERVRTVYESAGGNQVETVKFIVILREPISRELSMYNHCAFDCRTRPDIERNEWHNQVLKEDGSLMTFDEFVRDKTIPALLGPMSGPGRSSRYGMYAIYLSQWFQVFDRRQILVLSYDELRKNPFQLQRRIEQFLGVSIPGRIDWTNVNDNPFKVSSPSPASKKALDDIFQPMNERLYRLLEDYPGPSMELQPFPRFPQ